MLAPADPDDGLARPPSGQQTDQCRWCLLQSLEYDVPLLDAAELHPSRELQHGEREAASL